MDSGQFGSGGAFAVDLGRRGHSNLLLPPKGTSRPAQTSVEFGLRICSVLPVSDDVPFEDKKTIHAKTAKSRLESINKAASGYANLFGGVFPESLGALGSPPWGQQRIAGLPVCSRGGSTTRVLATSLNITVDLRRPLSRNLVEARRATPSQRDQLSMGRLDC
jgi:hypothetical protein